MWKRTIILLLFIATLNLAACAPLTIASHIDRDNLFRESRPFVKVSDILTDWQLAEWGQIGTEPTEIGVYWYPPEPPPHEVKVISQRVTQFPDVNQATAYYEQESTRPKVAPMTWTTPAWFTPDVLHVPVSQLACDPLQCEYIATCNVFVNKISIAAGHLVRDEDVQRLVFMADQKFAAVCSR
jgi:hypothetical protein